MTREHGCLDTLDGFTFHEKEIICLVLYNIISYRLNYETWNRIEIDNCTSSEPFYFNGLENDEIFPYFVVCAIWQHF